MTCLGSANRDPRQWGADADTLDLTRETPPCTSPSVAASITVWAPLSLASKA